MHAYHDIKAFEVLKYSFASCRVALCVHVCVYVCVTPSTLMRRSHPVHTDSVLIISHISTVPWSQARVLHQHIKSDNDSKNKTYTWNNEKTSGRKL